MLYGLIKGSTKIFKQTTSVYVPGLCGNVHWLGSSDQQCFPDTGATNHMTADAPSLGGRTEYLGNDHIVVRDEEEWDAGDQLTSCMTKTNRITLCFIYLSIYASSKRIPCELCEQF